MGCVGKNDLRLKGVVWYGIWSLQIDCFAAGVARDTHPNTINNNLMLCFMLLYYFELMNGDVFCKI